MGDVGHLLEELVGGPWRDGGDGDERHDPPYAGLHANGPGPFILVGHEPGVKTVWKRNPNWWDKPKSNIDEVVFTPIPNAATRVAALLSGEIDWMNPTPLNDQARVNANPGT